MKNELQHLLLIDDCSTTLFIHTKIIEKSGFKGKISTCKSGKEGLQFLNDCNNNLVPSPDLILLDMEMPMMNGFEFIKSLQNSPFNQNIPIVLISGTENPAEEKKASMHPNIFLFKPKPLTVDVYKEIHDAAKIGIFHRIAQ